MYHNAYVSAGKEINHGCRLPVCRTDPGQREITPIV